MRFLPVLELEHDFFHDTWCHENTTTANIMTITTLNHPEVRDTGVCRHWCLTHSQDTLYDELDETAGAYLISHLRPYCENCGTFETSQWRKGWTSGLLTHSVLLCNACGLKYHKVSDTTPFIFLTTSRISTALSVITSMERKMRNKHRKKIGWYVARVAVAATRNANWRWETHTWSTTPPSNVSAAERFSHRSDRRSCLSTNYFDTRSLSEMTNRYVYSTSTLLIIEPWTSSDEPKVHTHRNTKQNPQKRIITTIFML